MVEPFYLKGGEAEEKEGEDDLVQDGSRVYQSNRKVLELVQTVPDRTYACIPEVGQAVYGVGGGSFTK